MLVMFALILLLAIAAVTDISASYLRRQAVTNLADGAALAATDAAAAAGVYADPDAEYVTIDPEAAQEAVEQYLTSTGAYADYPGLAAEVWVDGYAVRVALTAPYDLPVPVPGVTSTVDVHGAGSSVMPIYQ
jgi:Flp pilus assembly protein TadG